MRECHILPKHISDMIMPLRAMIAKLSINSRMPQVEVAVGDKVDVLVFRNMDAINAADEKLLQQFADTHRQPDRPVQIWLQPGGPDTCYPIYPLDAPRLTYSLPQYSVEMPYYPTEFTQVNPQINAVMVSRAWASSTRNRASALPTCSAASATSPCPLPAPEPRYTAWKAARRW
jgi:23S rRNA (uracil1939-C5)-methyltransferase